MGIAESIIYNTLMSKFYAQRKALSDRNELLASPDKLAKQVSEVTAQFYPYTKKPPKMSKYVHKFQAYDESARKKGSAMGGFGAEVHDLYTRTLALPSSAGHDPQKVLGAVVQRVMTKRKDAEHMPRMAALYQEKMMADTDITNMFGLFGEDTDVRKPQGELLGFKPYDVAKAEFMAKPAAHAETGVGESMAIGAIGDALWMGGLKVFGRAAVGELAVAAGVALGAPPVAVAIGGAALLAVPMFKVLDAVSNKISETEWGRAREGTFRKSVMDFTVGGVLPIVAGRMALKTGIKRLAKAGVFEGTAFEKFIAKPTARATIDIKAAQDTVAKETSNFNRALAKADKRGLKGGVWDAIRSTESPDIVTPPQALSFKKAFKKLDEFDLDQVFKLKDRGRTLEEATQDVVENKVVKKTVAETTTKKAKKFEATKKTETFDPEFGTAEVASKMAEILNRPVKESRKGLTSWKSTGERLKEEGSLKAFVKDETYYEKRLKGKLEEVGGIEGVSPAEKILTEEITEADLKTYKKMQEESPSWEDDPILNPVKASEDILDVGVRDHDFSNKLFSTIAVLGTALTAATFELFSPKKAEAGMLSSGVKVALKGLEEAGVPLGKKVTKEATVAFENLVKVTGGKKEAIQAYSENFAKVAKEKGWIGEADGAYNFVAGKHPTLADLVAKQHGSLKGSIVSTDFVVGGLERFASPHTTAQLVFKSGTGAELEVAPMMSTMHHNTALAREAARNIFREVPEVMRQGAKATADIEARSTSLATQHGPTAVVMSAIDSKLAKKITTLENILKEKRPRKMTPKQHQAKIDSLRMEISDLEVAMEELQPAFDLFMKDAEVLHKELAPQYASSRIALAAEDTENFIHRPWLKDLISDKPDELAAVARLKKLYYNYADRLEEIGVDTIESRPFFPHAQHPSWTDKGAADLMKKLDVSVADIYPYTKFYRRSKYSVQTMPDAVYATNKYIPDIERRIGWTRFWGKRSDKNSWLSFAESPTVKDSPALSGFFERLRASSIPQPLTTGNKLANTYAALEVARLLSFSPSPAFKHIFKLIGDISTHGVMPVSRAAVSSAKDAATIWLKSPATREFTSKLGIKTATKKTALQDAKEAILHQGDLLSSLSDLELNYTMAPGYLGKFDSYLAKYNKPGSIPIRGIEAWDRGVSFMASIEMAAKRGYTAQQAYFGIYDTVLKNNFLSGPLNPTWMQNPMIRGLFLFQNTAFRIMERRLSAAYKTGKSVKLAWKEGRTVIKNDGIGEALKQLTDVRRFVKGAEGEFKRNIIADALGSQRDIFGRSITRQLMRETLLVGSIISGAGHVGVDLMPHTFHIPFLVASKSDPTLATSPASKAILKTFHEWTVANEEDRDFLPTTFLKSWLGSTRGMPLMLNKGLRINDGDIPAIYEEGAFPSWLKYLFSVPGVARD